MSSMIRNLQRKQARKAADYVPATQPTRITANGYETLRATLGWLKVSYRRLMAQMRVAQTLDSGLVSNGRAPKPAKDWSPAHAGPIPTGTVTRQRRRFAARHGLPEPVEVVAAAAKPKRVRKAATGSTPRKSRAKAAL